MRERIFIFYLLFFVAFGVLTFKLFDLTIVNGTRNRELSENQRIRLKKITAPRGIIFDRHGRALVENIPVYRRCPFISLAPEEKDCLALTRKEALKLESEGKETELTVNVGRRYLYQGATAHLLGYLTETTKEEVTSGEKQLGDLVGRGGVEGEYEDLLHGTDGGELVETDTNGQVVRKLGRREPVPGTNIPLSIDFKLQKTAFQALEGKKGAVVAQNPQTGEVLVLVSSPSFNPNSLDEETLTSPDYPFLNRAISGVYPPGSTFKIVTATAGLEEGKVNAETEIEDTGQISVGIYSYTNWYFTQYGKTEGLINITRALGRSTDTFFYKLGEMIGARKIIEWSKAFGLGRPTGIDLASEVSGFLPDPTKGDWFLGNTYHLSIGQGSLGFTPIQVNMMTGVVASRGNLCKPHLVKNEKNQKCEEVKIKSETLDLVTEGMRQACAAGGTAFPFFEFTPAVACKTGTAEFGDPKDRTHAWLTAFAPIDSPEIVITVLVEAGGEGSRVAAPIAREVLEEYFNK